MYNILHTTYKQTYLVFFSVVLLGVQLVSVIQERCYSVIGFR